MKHSPPGASVTIGAEFLEQNPSPESTVWLALWVEDQGSGIPAEDHERIFERFYRRGSELRRETPGAGIGLSIVRHIAEGHGGRVQVRSAPGQGSRFTLVLPVKDVLQSVSATDPQPLPDPPSHATNSHR